MRPLLNTSPAGDRPQYLFPTGARFGADNLVLHAESKRHVVDDFAGPLSIKTVMAGQVEWIVEGRRLVVDPGSFLILNDGERYTMAIDEPEPVKTCCAFFAQGFVERIAHDATRALDTCLDEPDRAAPPLRFVSRLHPTAPVAVKVRSLARRCNEQLQPSGLQEDFLVLSTMMLALHADVRAQMARVPAAKATTRAELFARLQIAREYLHGCVDQAVSLDELAKAACLSRYHLHRVFTQVFGRTPHRYLTDLKLQRARALLCAGTSVTDAALSVGFAGVASFSRRFKARFGVPPSALGSTEQDRTSDSPAGPL